MPPFDAGALPSANELAVTAAPYPHHRRRRHHTYQPLHPSVRTPNEKSPKRCVGSRELKRRARGWRCGGRSASRRRETKAAAGGGVPALSGPRDGRARAAIHQATYLSDIVKHRRPPPPPPPAPARPRTIRVPSLTPPSAAAAAAAAALSLSVNCTFPVKQDAPVARRREADSPGGGAEGEPGNSKRGLTAAVIAAQNSPLRSVCGGGGGSGGGGGGGGPGHGLF
ncbi:androgen receptor-like [Schistocerca piceifrons]|uniref:androgen receptor-like n=1 Tax=Schistocerca piceifrons TaxID=274613 RepID=UPI001F5EDE11|nr:androgen receptor-like [Schistocerca piceifrons]